MYSFFGDTRYKTNYLFHKILKFAYVQDGKVFFFNIEHDIIKFTLKITLIMSEEDSVPKYHILEPT